MNLQKNYILLFIAFIIFIGLSAFLSISIFSFNSSNMFIYLKSQKYNKKTTYSERKKLGINVTEQILIENNFHDQKSYFNQHKKKDDLADSFLQGLWYIKNII